MIKKTTIIVDNFSGFFLFTAVLSSLLFANGLYLFACFTTLLLLFYQLLGPYRTGVFPLILIQHILQIVATVIQANFLGKDINYRSPESGTAIILSLIGMVFLFIPILFVQKKIAYVTLIDLQKYAEQISTEKCMYFYIGSFFIATSLSGIAFLFPGITQIILSTIKIKWLFFLLFGFVSLIKKEKRSFFYIFIALEFIMGFFSFFSDFKTVIFYVVLLLATFILTIRLKSLVYLFIVSGLLIYVALLWTAVKGDYRKYLNAGKGQQTIEVSRNDALNKLYQLSGNLEESNFQNSTDNFFDRLQYTYHFAKSIERVPSIVPYQDGQNWLSILEFTTTPRFLNPDKPSIDNSVKTSKYTGINYLGAKSGVSFSLGYFAECYVDFGIVGMMIPLFLIGCIYALLYDYFIKKSSPNLLFNYAVIGSFFMEFNGYEMDGTFLVGRLFASILTYVFLIIYIFPSMYRYMLIKKDYV